MPWHPLNPDHERAFDWLRPLVHARYDSYDIHSSHRPVLSFSRCEREARLKPRVQRQITSTGKRQFMLEEYQKNPPNSPHTIIRTSGSFACDFRAANICCFFFYPKPLYHTPTLSLFHLRTLPLLSPLQRAELLCREKPEHVICLVVFTSSHIASFAHIWLACIRAQNQKKKTGKTTGEWLHGKGRLAASLRTHNVTCFQCR
jgi:hypothetical protein